jgi:hypothetical protein
MQTTDGKKREAGEEDAHCVLPPAGFREAEDDLNSMITMNRLSALKQRLLVGVGLAGLDPRGRWLH